MKDRYFFIVYEGFAKIRNTNVKGSFCVKTPGKYVNQILICQAIVKNFHVQNPGIVGITELSEEDFNEYRRIPDDN